MPALHLLKQAKLRDELARQMRPQSPSGDDSEGASKPGGFQRICELLEGKGRGIWRDDDERVLLAICPGVRKHVDLFERMARH